MTLLLNNCTCGYETAMMSPFSNSPTQESFTLSFPKVCGIIRWQLLICLIR